MDRKQFTLGSLFDGIGGFPYAASFYDIKPLWASEILPAAVSVTQRHFPEMEHVGDITRLNGRKLPPVDILTFGSPCQGLSMAGRRLGLADERSGLFTEAVRIIREMQEATHGKYPKLALWENVPGALSSAGGRDFKAVLEAFTEAEVSMPRSGRWANAGMVRSPGTDLAWCVYDAQYFGTAQRRRRVFLVVDFTGRRAGEILFVPKRLRGYFEAGGTPRQGLAAFAENGSGMADGPVKKAVEILNDQGGSSLCVEQGGVSPTLRSQTHGNLPVVALGFELQQITSKANRTTLKSVQPTLCGAGSPHVICMSSGQANAGMMDNAAPTLTSAHAQPIIVYPEIAGTLCASGAGLSRPAGQGNELDFCVLSAGFRYKAGSAAGSVGYQEETAPTLAAGQQSGVLKVCIKDGIILVGTDDGWQEWELTVRRLTPLECERLQGFPDGWTEYGGDGRPISDTSRYQMLGNSVAVPCVAYIMQGMTRALETR